MKKYLLLIVVLLAFFLRLYKLDQVPPSLYWDEASLGYNAYSISQTLHDEHGVFLPPTYFAAFGDYKPPAYIYAIVPFIKIFGLTEIAVRLPSAIAGTLLVLTTYFLVLELFEDKKKLAMLAAFFVGISPWSLQMSRAGFEANLATLFSGIGILLFLKAVRKQKIKFYLLSALFLIISMYTFNSHRVFSPIMAAGLSLIFVKEIIKNWKKSIFFYLLAVVLLAPLIPHLTSPEGRLRFEEVSWVNDLSIVENSNKLITQNDNSLLAKLIYNRRVFYAEDFISHYMDHYRFSFLFGSGDINTRLSIQSVGEMYLLDLPFLVLGLLFLLKKRTKSTAVILFWLLVAPIPAAMARETPHALRTLNVLPIPQLISALGLYWLLQYRNWVKYLIAPIVFLSVVLYLNSYYTQYPQKYDLDWQYGYKQAVEYVASIQKNYARVDVTNHYGRPYIYFLFYNQYSPEKFYNFRMASEDEFGFWSVSSFDKYYFDNFEPAKAGKTLYVEAPGEDVGSKKLLKTIYDLNDQPVFLILEK